MILSRSCDNKNTVKDHINLTKTFHQILLVEMIGMPDINKDNDMDSLS